MNKMRTVPETIDGLRALSKEYWWDSAFLNDAANYIEGTTENLRQQAEQLIAMRVKLERVRPLMEEAASTLEDLYDMYRSNQHHEREMELPRAIRAMLRWWEPGATEPVSISHWGVIE